ncbi:unnamed protein product [Echinostoma caproni]|uniref:Reverse transcriptase domain-containing protein n=1 Tax=Echinostoma caproni TaxID=27848 RepID=A0A183AZG2_9TREM|nr:unnamed protein product [Echinostoma caproni]
MYHYDPCRIHNSTQLQFARYLFQLLRPSLPANQNDAKCPTVILERIKGLTIEPDEVMVSFDVTSLFTNKPKQMAIESIRHLLSNDQNLQLRTKLSVDEIVKFVELCMETYFQFRGKVYQQIQGTPMGSPLSGLLADAVMKHFEVKAFEILQPRLWIRYVDDTFVILRAFTVD